MAEVMLLGGSHHGDLMQVNIASRRPYIELMEKKEFKPELMPPDGSPVSPETYKIEIYHFSGKVDIPYENKTVYIYVYKGPL